MKISKTGFRKLSAADKKKVRAMVKKTKAKSSRRKRRY